MEAASLLHGLTTAPPEFETFNLLLMAVALAHIETLNAWT